jgi:phosphate transport system substrate-binding protein
MKRSYFAALFLLCAVFIAPENISTVYAQAGKSIRIKGSNIMASMVDEWAKAFAEKNPGINVVVHGGGTAAGFEALFDKGADIAPASRELLEKELQGAAIAGSKPDKMEVGLWAVAIIANPANKLSSLTVEQVRKIFSGEFTNWSEVGGDNEPITVVISQPDSGTSIFLQKTLLEDGYFSSDAKVKNYFYEIMKEVSYKKSAIGFASLTDARKGVKNGWVKILGVKRNAESPAVFPSVETEKNKSYPILQPLYLYWDSNRVPEHVKRFLEFCKKQRE